ncbi:MAG: hypothetical protein GQ582_04490 [Methyloprofundus sp.]|nr:hypothetical protein [Methyloprofundus sp.]
MKAYQAILKILDDQQKEEYFELKGYFSSLPKYFATELAVKLQQIELKAL